MVMFLPWFVLAYRSFVPKRNVDDQRLPLGTGKKKKVSHVFSIPN